MKLTIVKWYVVGFDVEPQQIGIYADDVRVTQLFEINEMCTWLDGFRACAKVAGIELEEETVERTHHTWGLMPFPEALHVALALGGGLPGSSEELTD